MGDTPVFSYFTGQEADMLTFYRVPKLLITNEYFKGISSDAKILYGLALDRMSLSLKNAWFDGENRAYIYFSIEEIAELLNCGKNKAVSALKELETIGLIEKKRQGMGKSNVLYLKNFIIENEMQNVKNQTSENVPEFRNVNFLNPEIRDSRIPKSKLLECYNSGSNNNNLNNTDFSDTKSHQIISMDSDRMRAFNTYGEIIRDNIDLDGLIVSHPMDRELLEGIYDMILETVLCTSDEILIASSKYPTELVKSKFLKLNYSHIEYVLTGLKTSTNKVRNIKKYLLAALFNAPSTISGYYQAEVQHDMPWMAQI